MGRSRRGRGHLGAQRGGQRSKRRPYCRHLAARHDAMACNVLQKSRGEAVELLALRPDAAGVHRAEQWPELGHQQTPRRDGDVAVTDTVHDCPCNGPCVFFRSGKPLTGCAQHVV
jgi:hypothetical protein